MVIVQATTSILDAAIENNNIEIEVSNSIAQLLQEMTGSQRRQSTIEIENSIATWENKRLVIIIIPKQLMRQSRNAFPKAQDLSILPEWGTIK